MDLNTWKIDCIGHELVEILIAKFPATQKRRGARRMKEKCSYFRPMNDMQNTPDGSLLVDLVRMKMPFGKYKGTVLCYLPVSYLEWFAKEGFPAGKLGMLLATIYEIKINGLEHLLKPIQQKMS